MWPARRIRSKVSAQMSRLMMFPIGRYILDRIVHLYRFLPAFAETTMTTILGEGPFRYAVNANWGKLPDGWELNDVAAVAVDKQDRVYVFNRGAHPMIVFDREGNFLRSWGEGLFNRAHGLHMGPAKVCIAPTMVTTVSANVHSRARYC